MSESEKVDCPFCEGNGVYAPWYNDITDELVVDDICDSCNGTGKCDKDLADHFIANKESENEELPILTNPHPPPLGEKKNGKELSDYSS